MSAQLPSRTFAAPSWEKAREDASPCVRRGALHVTATTGASGIPPPRIPPPLTPPHKGEGDTRRLFATESAVVTNIASSRARTMRKEKTDAERKLWHSLRDLNRQGFHFRQQAPIGKYIADFCDHSAKLVIEVDGGQHGEDDQRRHDDERTAWLNGEGYQVVRFWNGDVLTNLDGVMTSILIALGLIRTAAASPETIAGYSPPPRGEGSGVGGSPTAATCGPPRASMVDAEAEDEHTAPHRSVRTP